MVAEVKYREFLEHHLDPEVSRLYMTSRYWFMQNGKRSHRTAHVFTWLKRTFGQCLIVLNAEKFMGHVTEWPPYNPDLKPFDFFLWGYIKYKIYRNPPYSLEHLTSAIRSETDSLDSNTFQRLMTEFQNRL